MKRHKKNCYCNLKEEDTNAVTSVSIPEGFCCLCSRCNQPGHIRFESAGTKIYALCDECYRMDKAMKVVKIMGFVFLVAIAAFFKI